MVSNTGIIDREDQRPECTIANLEPSSLLQWCSTIQGLAAWRYLPVQCHTHHRARATYIGSFFLPLTSVLVNEVHSNCAILYATLFFTYAVDSIKTMFRPGTPGSEGLRMILPLFACLAGEQNQGVGCGNSTCVYRPGVQPWHPRT